MPNADKSKYNSCMWLEKLDSDEDNSSYIIFSTDSNHNFTSSSAFKSWSDIRKVNHLDAGLVIMPCKPAANNSFAIIPVLSIALRLRLSPGVLLPTISVRRGNTTSAISCQWCSQLRLSSRNSSYLFIYDCASVGIDSLLPLLNHTLLHRIARTRTRSLFSFRGLFHSSFSIWEFFTRYIWHCITSFSCEIYPLCVML